MCHHSLVSVVC